MSDVGKHSGEPVEEEALRPDRRRLLVLAGAMTATVVAWGFLVVGAIDFGSQARGGESAAWIFAVLATLGATACMFVTLILGTKLLAALRGEPVRTPAPGGGRRAAR